MKKMARHQKSKKVTSNVVDMKGKKLDSSKPIMGGTQEGGLDNIFNEMYGDFQKDKLKFMSGKHHHQEVKKQILQYNLIEAE